MPDIRTQRGFSWHYEIQGQGENLFFIHGWAADHRIWQQQLNYFSAYYETVAVDLPGHGKSGWSDMTLKDLVEDLEFIRQELKLSQLNLVGSSMGGLIALKYYDMFPENVRRIALVGSLPKFFKSENYPYGLDTPRIRKLSTQLDTDYPMILNIFFRSLFTIEERESAKFKWLHTFRPDSDVPDRQALKWLLRLLEKEDLIESLSKITVPVQFINGTDDYICTPAAVDFFSQKIKRCSVRYIESCGHFPFLTKAQEFNQLLELFLNDYANPSV